jgi:hypothetical protein
MPTSEFPEFMKDPCAIARRISPSEAFRRFAGLHLQPQLLLHRGEQIRRRIGIGVGHAVRRWRAAEEPAELRLMSTSGRCAPSPV